MATERIDIVVSERGSRTVRRNLDNIGDSATGAQGAVQLLRRALGALGGALAVRELVQLVDTFTNLQNRLRLVTNGAQQLAQTTSRLFEISNRTRSSFESTTEVFARTALALKDFGVTQQEVLQFTESLNQAVILSGASAQEAQAGLIQLSQGLASGALRGDELRSVLEQLPAVADVIAKSLDITRGELRKLGQEGKITSDIILRAFAEAREELAGQFAQTVPTIGQAFTVLRNNFIQFIGGVDQAIGASRALAQLILFLADNVDILARAFAAAAIVIGVVFAQRAIAAAINGIRALTAAIAANPLGALAIAITTVISLLITFGDKIGITLETIATVAARVADGFVGTFVGAFRAIVATFDRLPQALASLFFDGLSRVSVIVNNALNALIAGINRITEFLGIGTIGRVDVSFENPLSEQAQAAGATAAQAFREGFESVTFAQDLVKRLFGEDPAAVAEEAIPEENIRRREKVIELTKQQASALRSLRDRLEPAEALQRQFTEEVKLLDLALKAGKISGDEYADLLQRLTKEFEDAKNELALELNPALRRQKELLEEIRGPAEEYAQTVEALNALLAEGAITQAEFNDKFRELRLDLLDQQTDVFSGFERGFIRATENISDFASTSEQLITDAFENAQEVVEEFFKTGEFNAQRFIESLRDNFIKLGTQQLFAGAFGGGGPGGGIANLILGQGQQQGGGGGLGGIFSGGLGGIFGSLGGLFGFQNGAENIAVNSLSVARLSGIDNRLVAFRARNDETVSVRRRGEAPTVMGGPVNISVQTDNADSFNRSRGQVLNRTAAAIQRQQARR